MPSLNRRPERRRPSKGVARRRSREDFQGDSERREDRPPRVGARPQIPRRRRHLLGDAIDRLARLDARPVEYARRCGEGRSRFRSLHDAWADTTTPHGRLMLTVLGGLSELARLDTRPDGRRPRPRQARGVHMGRPPKLTRHQRRRSARALAEGTVHAGRSCAPLQRQPQHDFEALALA